MRLAALTLVLASLGLHAAPKRHSKHRHTTPRAASTSDAKVHVVRKGETAAQVARSNELTLGELAALNPEIKLSRLSVGMRLLIEKPLAQALPQTSMGMVEPSVPRIPLPPVPASPVFASLPMPHLERLLPFQTRILAPGEDARTLPAGDSGVLSQFLSQLHPVFPPLSETEYKALLPVFTPADRDHLDLLWPVGTRTISSAWGPRIRTRVVRTKNQRKKRIRYRGRHKGVDLTAPLGTDVYAAMDGEVVFAGKHGGYGNYVILDHGNGVQTLYGHHRLNLVHAGDIVRRGQKIAEVGRTGNATGPHLHFELRLDGVQQNPLPALNDEEEVPAEMAAQNALVGDSSAHGSGILH